MIPVTMGGNRSRLSVSVKKYDQPDCHTTTHQEVRELILPTGTVGAMLPDALILSIVDDFGDVLRGQSLKERIECRASKLSN